MEDDELIEKFKKYPRESEVLVPRPGRKTTKKTSHRSGKDQQGPQKKPQSPPNQENPHLPGSLT